MILAVFLMAVGAWVFACCTTRSTSSAFAYKAAWPAFFFAVLITTVAGILLR